MDADRLVLLEPSGRKHLVALDRDMVQVPRVGVVRADALRASVGRRWTVGGRSFLVLTPSIRDVVASMRRQAQIIGLKDAATLVWNCDLKAGDFVVEAGAGSGALTLVLAQAVGPGGRVVTYDMRPDFLDVARTNVANAGFGGRVEFRQGDVRSGIQERDADACLLDIPDPWEAIGTAKDAMKPCGHFASYSPNMEQVSHTAAALRAGPFVDIRTVEIIEREIIAAEAGTHPSFAPLGHTGYLTFARKVLDTF
ncbi:MAG TPA: tRNA (adenine-N1)-methyltransferase [Thermoplasmata archaeon]|nr:tRNA (adenine-N1)-methyltransferase [Thermoplasmata archaeon]